MFLRGKLAPGFQPGLPTQGFYSRSDLRKFLEEKFSQSSTASAASAKPQYFEDFSDDFLEGLFLVASLISISHSLPEFFSKKDI